MVKFERGILQETLEPGDAILTLTDKVFYNQDLADFEGSDTLRVIDQGKGKK